MVASNADTDKLSNGTPHDYGTLKYKIEVLRGFRGFIRGFMGTRRAKMPEIWLHLTLILTSFRMIPHMTMVL